MSTVASGSVPAAASIPGLRDEARRQQKPLLALLSPFCMLPRRSRNRGVESPKGDHHGHPLARHLRPFRARRRAGPARGRDRRAVGARRGRHCAPPGPDPRVRRARGLEHRLPLLRRLAELARGPRPRGGPGTGPRRARPRHPALLAQALARGELSYAKVRARTRVATEGGTHVPAEPSMWLSPLPVLAETRYAHARGARGRRRYWCHRARRGT
jgi:hypothetical protein